MRAAAIAIDGTTLKGLFLRWKKLKWTIPGGGVKPQEANDHERTVRRELREEAGVPENAPLELIHQFKHEDTTYYLFMMEHLEDEYWQGDWFSKRTPRDHDKFDMAYFFRLDDPKICPVYNNVAHVLSVLKQAWQTLDAGSCETPPWQRVDDSRCEAPPWQRMDAGRCETPPLRRVDAGRWEASSTGRSLPPLEKPPF